MKEILEEVQRLLNKGKHVAIRMGFCNCSGPTVGLEIEIHEDGKPGLHATIADINPLDLQELIVQALIATERSGELIHAKDSGTDTLH